MTDPKFADDLARAHEVADQATRLIELFGERLAVLMAAWKAEHTDPAWSERVGGAEAWEAPFEESGLRALYDRLEDLETAVGNAEDRVSEATRRARVAARADR